MNELSAIVNKDRTTVQRSLNRLVRTGLCEKKKLFLNGGGYYYVYTSKNPDDIRILLENCINEWYKAIKDMINQMENPNELDF